MNRNPLLGRVLCRLLLCASSCLPCAVLAQPSDEAGIRAVIESFRTAIIDKDRARFTGLFVDGGVAWRSVVSDAVLERWRARDPKITKIDAAGSHLAFIDGIVADKARTEETFDRIRIDGDDDLASVVFDYRFLSAGRETNRGTEAWHLLRTGQGWRIVSVVWSMEAVADAAP